LAGAPDISVIVPVLNAAATLGDQLEALARQSFSGEWELIVSDNGSSDVSLEVAKQWRSRIPLLRIVDASERSGAAAARNIGAAAARGERLAFCDADDVVSEGWVAAMAAALRKHDFVAGALDHTSLNPITATWQNFQVSSAPRAMRFMPYSWSCNLGVSRRAFEEVGGFAEDLGTAAAGDDVDLSWRLQLAGYKLYFDPSAVVAYRHRRSLRALWRQHSQYGMAEPVLFKRFHPHGVPRSRVSAASRVYLKLLKRVPLLLGSRRRVDWVREAAMCWGRVKGSLRSQVLYL
jgi:GT2 family glycosyltransferase